MVNLVILIGNVGRDPEVKYTQSGTAVCNFTVATTERYDGKEVTTWHNIVAWKRLAEICGEYLTKGSKVYISGKIQNRKYQDKEGKDRYITEIVTREMKMLGSKPQGNADDSPPDPSMDDIPF